MQQSSGAGPHIHIDAHWGIARRAAARKSVIFHEITLYAHCQYEPTVLYSFIRVYMKYLIFILFLTVMTPLNADAYIGPGAGLTVVSSFFVVFTAFLSAAGAILMWPLRYT
ncbi:MAG: hypothetical protein JXN60_00190, partial [Lentisphaerae bacterium]|nr:hypothetical protein [Lentisphaerota bacterium]